MFNYELRPDINNMNNILIKYFMSYAKGIYTPTSLLNVTTIRYSNLYVSLPLI